MYDAVNARYEPPWPIRPDPKSYSSQPVNRKYQFYSDNTSPGFKIYRVSDNTTL